MYVCFYTKNLNFFIKYFILVPINRKPVEIHGKNYFDLRRFELRRLFSVPINDANRGLGLFKSAVNSSRMRCHTESS